MHIQSVLGILWLVFFIWALLDIVQAPRDIGWKLLWVIVCLVFPVVGVLVYYFIGRKR